MRTGKVCSYKQIPLPILGSLSSKATGNAEAANGFQSEDYFSFPNPEGNSGTSGEEETASGKTPLNPEQEEHKNSREKSSEKNGKEAFIRRLSPEGAECHVVNAQMTSEEADTASYLMVPDKRFVSEAQRRDVLGGSLSRSPSGRMDDKDYWALDDDMEGRKLLQEWPPLMFDTQNI